MADMNSPANESPTVSLTGKRFADMSAGEKITWLGKCVVMVFTGGFAFPNIFVD